MKPTLFVCTNHRLGTAGSCAGGASRSLLDELRGRVAERGLGWTVAESGCLGHCATGPSVKAAPNGPMLQGCSPGRADDILDRLLASWP